jgi:hypothetical protein
MALDPLTAGVNLASTVIDKIWPNAGEAERSKLTAAIALAEAQIKVNTAEAGHRSMFVAGWRPFIGWTCGVALAYTFVGYPMALWATTLWADGVTPPQLTVDGMLYELLFGMLGIGALRTFEKIKGVTR